MNRKERLQKVLKGVKKIVIKVGSAVITEEDQGLNYGVLKNLVQDIKELLDKGYKVVLVSSGAIACGRNKLKLKKNVFSLSEKQALASIGQATLIQAYEELFQPYGIKVAQILLTSQDLSQRERYLNAKKTFQTLLKWGILPVVNENDTVATEEIKFGDNDVLSALVAGTVEADFLMVLSDVDALYDKDPRFNENVKRIKEVEKITEEVFAMAGSKPGRLGRGGMYSKLLAAKWVTSMGIPMVILPGRMPGVLQKFWNGEDIGTIFWAEERKLNMRKLWIKYYIKPEGKIFIDPGAEKALTQNGKSLLIGGIIKIEGDFPRGACVECVNSQEKPIAKGLTSFSSEEIKKYLSNKEKILKEIIHRDNLVLI
jgi:glutamate 5-kinase